jgi:hypothetical protein
MKFVFIGYYEIVIVDLSIEMNSSIENVNVNDYSNDHDQNLIDYFPNDFDH